MKMTGVIENAVIDSDHYRRAGGGRVSVGTRVRGFRLRAVARRRSHLRFRRLQDGAQERPHVGHEAFARRANQLKDILSKNPV